MSKDLRIIFMGTPDFAVGVLEKMIANNMNIVGVITAPDRPAGRGRKVNESAVKKYAISQQLKVLQPTNLKDEGFLQELESLRATLQVVVAFRMLPKQVWAMPKYGTFNLHASLLPQYRGAAPINWAIINGESKTGVTTFFIDEKIDTGAIIAKKEIAITAEETAGSLHDKLMHLGSDLVVDTIHQIAQGTVEAIPQPMTEILKDAPKLTPENTRIDWTQSGKTIENLIRGLSPYPVAWTELIMADTPSKVKIYAAHFVEKTHTNPPGAILSDKKTLKIACPDGYLSVKEIQLPGKRKMDIQSLLNGFTFSDGSKMR